MQLKTIIPHDTMMGLVEAYIAHKMNMAVTLLKIENSSNGLTTSIQRDIVQVEAVFEKVS